MTWHLSWPPILSSLLSTWPSSPLNSPPFNSSSWNCPPPLPSFSPSSFASSTSSRKSLCSLSIIIHRLCLAEFGQTLNGKRYYYKMTVTKHKKLNLDPNLAKKIPSITSTTVSKRPFHRGLAADFPWTSRSVSWTSSIPDICHRHHRHVCVKEIDQRKFLQI